MEFRHPSYYKKLKKQKAASVKPEELAARNAQNFVEGASHKRRDTRSDEPRNLGQTDPERSGKFSSNKQQASSDPL